MGIDKSRLLIEDKSTSTRENFKYSKKITENGKKKQVTKTLEDIGQEYPNIDIIKVIEETGVELEYELGFRKMNAVQVVNGTGDYRITEKEKQKLIELGVVNLETKETCSQSLSLIKEIVLLSRNRETGRFLFIL